MGQPEVVTGGGGHGEHGKQHSTLVIVLWVTAWYSVSSVNSYSINRTFDDEGMGVAQLLLLQYIAGVVMGLGSRRISFATLAKFNSDEFICGAMHASGSLATLASLKLLRPPFVQMSKALEPVFGVVFAFLLGFPLEPRRQFLISLLISGGLGLTVINEAMASCWSLVPFLLALFSCICFQLRNVFSKRYLETSKVPAATFYFVMCRDAFYCSALFFLVYQFLSPRPLASWLGQWSGIEAVTYTLYNLISYFVLEMVSSPVTHAILGTLKRAVIISSLALLYHIPITTLFLLGSACTLTGCYLHSIVAKRLPKPSFGSMTKQTKTALFALSLVVLTVILAFSVSVGHREARPECSTASNKNVGVDRDSSNSNSNHNDNGATGPSGPLSFTCREQIVPVFFWNGRVGMWRRGNFGDDFNIAVISVMLNVTHTAVKRVDQKSSDPKVTPAFSGPKLLATGSVLSFVRAGDVLWGSGVHEKSLPKVDWPAVQDSKIAALRGPLTCAIIKKEGVLECGTGVGDPGLLAPLVWPWLHPSARPHFPRCFLPHHFDESLVDKAKELGFQPILSSQAPVKVAEALMQCGHVLSSSLHGLIFADAFGIPATWLRNTSFPAAEEGILKYRDYFAATGRTASPVASLTEPLVAHPRLADEKLAKLLHGLVDAFPYESVCADKIGVVARMELKRRIKARLGF